MYDYLIVGSGLFGSIFAYEAAKHGFTCLVVDRRSHVGGNIYTECIDDIHVHKYGAHIFKTSNKVIWDYMNQFAEFNNFVNSPIANYKGEIYNLPFNMNTFNKLWGISKPDEARKIINEQSKSINNKPKNFEEHAISFVGVDIYHKLIKEYTEKQWGRSCRDLPVTIMRRLPVRFTYDNNYYNDKYQGIPIGGYTGIINKMLSNITVKLNIDFIKYKNELYNIAKKIVFTGTIDSFFNYTYGKLDYRSLLFITESYKTNNFQGVAVINYTDKDTPYTRSIEHKHFEFGNQPNTIVSYEYPQEYNHINEPYYPINDKKNQSRYIQYRKLALTDKKIIFGGRLGEYKYYDMQDTIISALNLIKKEVIAS